MTKNWSVSEIDTTFAAYLKMLQQQQAGTPFVKAEIVRELLAGPLHQRTRGAIERRFQNYSHLLREKGLEWVRGYAPLAHVGPVVTERVDQLLERPE
jgi:hypothetical protein